jgi:sugar phosphate isomerase/epimerase
MKRRTFVKTVSAGMLAGMLMPRQLYANLPVMNNIGLQLYSLRNEVKEDLEGSLQKIGEIGYQNLEAAGYSDGKFYGLEPAEFKTLVQKYGMKIISSHLTFDMKDISAVLNAHKEAGIKYLVWPWIGKEQRESIDKYKELANKFNTIGELCKANNLAFGYHNHDFEFHAINGEIPYNVLLESTNPDFVFMQIDLYWIIYAGHDPVEYFEKYPGRFKLWHVKDMKAGAGKEMTEVGTGIIDYKNLFTYKSQAGMKEFFVEQDVIVGDGFESVKKSFDFLNEIN